ncbi:hypothetical protein MG293_017009 [Ovis ammon polii]|uniref:Uncharacterized protein n=1 Tax=Ovis ammon polii TaxID=230172 RepID=A0AAD4TYM4_OVIAM|nr:hypothetical protein MG293_017009 [Ovis ammon polii]
MHPGLGLLFRPGPSPEASPDSEDKALEKKTAETPNKESGDCQQEAEHNSQLISMIHKEVHRIKQAHPHRGKRSSKGAESHLSSDPSRQPGAAGAGDGKRGGARCRKQPDQPRPQFPPAAGAQQRSSAVKAAFSSSSRTRLLYFRN